MAFLHVMDKGSPQLRLQISYQKCKEVLSHQPQVEQFQERSPFWSPDHHLSSWLPQCLRTEGYYNWSCPGLPPSSCAKGLGYVTRKKMEKTWAQKGNSHYRDKSSPSFTFCLSIHLLVLHVAFQTSAHLNWGWSDLDLSYIFMSITPDCETEFTQE